MIRTLVRIDVEATRSPGSGLGAALDDYDFTWQTFVRYTLMAFIAACTCLVSPEENAFSWVSESLVKLYFTDANIAMNLSTYAKSVVKSPFSCEGELATMNVSSDFNLVYVA